MTVTAFVQARMGSTRLPGKVLEVICSRPAITWILERTAAAPGIDEVVAVVPDGPLDEPLRAAVRRAGVRCIQGSEVDVLDRFQKAAEEVGAETIVRITADCPLVDPQVIGRVVDLYEARQVDYASVATGALPPSTGLARFPDGLDAEVLSAEALATAWREAGDPYDREHVTPFIRKRPERFGIAVLEAEQDFGDERWTIDHPDDLAFVRRVYERLAPRETFGYRDVLAFLEESPDVRQLNAAHRAN